jgi:GNAT superfamily N-acetyltransferase
MTAVIEKASRAEIDAVVGMVRSFYEESSYPFEVAAVYAAVDALIADPKKGGLWIVKADGEAVGYAVLTYGFSIEYGGVDAFVDEIWLTEKRRGQGFGSKLFARMDEQCRRHGVRALHLEVERANAAAQRLYRGWGFEVHGRTLMTKILA